MADPHPNKHDKGNAVYILVHQHGQEKNTLEIYPMGKFACFSAFTKKTHPFCFRPVLLFFPLTHGSAWKGTGSTGSRAAGGQGQGSGAGKGPPRAGVQGGRDASRGGSRFDNRRARQLGQAIAPSRDKGDTVLIARLHVMWHV